jgi:DNA-binding response OmpR family regulator
MDNAKPELILIVDDDPINLAVASRTLENMGLTTITAQEGLTALSKAKREKPALILLDIMMPELSGYEVCQRLKSEEDTKNIPVIFMTALSYSGDKVKAFEMGAADYVVKPIQSDELLARITTHLLLLRQQDEIDRLKRQLAALKQD